MRYHSLTKWQVESVLLLSVNYSHSTLKEATRQVTIQRNGCVQNFDQQDQMLMLNQANEGLPHKTGSTVIVKFSIGLQWNPSYEEAPYLRKPLI